MDSDPWNVCEEATVLQGGLLLAEKLYHPKPLIKLSKSDWIIVGHPVLHAVEEICTRFLGSQPSLAQYWKKRVVAIIWAKILDCQSEAALHPESRDVDRQWKEDLFFPMGNMVPGINHTILFELLKSLKTAEAFSKLLLALPANICSKEAALFVDHVLQESTEEDVVAFLDVWWEVMKHNDQQQDDTVAAFGTLARQYEFESSDGFTQPAKRFKCDPLPLYSSHPCAGVLAIFLKGLKQMKENILLSKLKCCAVAILADTLSAYAFNDIKSETLSIEKYLVKVAKIICVWNRDPQSPCHHGSLSEKVKEAERLVRVTGETSKHTLSLDEKQLGLSVLNDLLLCWGRELQCAVTDTSKNAQESYRTIDSLEVLLEKLMAPGNCVAPEMTEELRQHIEPLLEKVAAVLPGNSTVDTDTFSSVTMIVIAQKLYRHTEACSVFASSSEWALSTDWVICLEENKVLFQEPYLIFTLLSTVAAASVDSNSDKIQRINQAMESILSSFSDLSLADKNKILLKVLSTWGRKGLSQKLKVYMDGFQEELNTAFNKITQSTSDSGIAKAASAVARLALLHPEATVRKLCHVAVGNLGAHTFLAQIIKCLPSLSFVDSQDTRPSLLVDCLKETSWGNFSSDKEERQFLSFVISLIKPSESSGEPNSCSLLCPEEVIRILVLPYLTSDFSSITLCLQILNTALTEEAPVKKLDRHWVMSCSPFPLIFSLCRLLDEYTMCWTKSNRPQCLFIESKDLIIRALQRMCDLLQLEAGNFSDTWNRSLFWLHRKMEHLDWTVGLRLKNLFGDHFKNEVPATLFEVCSLSEDEWTPLSLPEYGPGTGLLAWMECCCLSGAMRDQMLSLLSVNVKKPDDVNYFSKGFLVALVQVFPWCNPREWDLLSQVVKTLLQRQLLHVPYTLEYVQFMPLLNLRPFAHNLQYSVLLLRGFQFLCSSSCSDWLPVDGWKHVGRLYCSSIAGMLESVKQVLSSFEIQEGAKDGNLFQEALFVYTQVFCHVLHIIAMMPPDTSEPLYFLSLEILSFYEAAGVADTSTNNLLRRANERHFLHSITENVCNAELRTMMLQKISKLK